MSKYHNKKVEYYIRYYNTLNKGWNRIHAKILQEDKPKKIKSIKTEEDIRIEKIYYEFQLYQRHLFSIMKEVI